MLIGKRSCIRPLDQSDLEEVYQWYQDSDFLYWVSGDWPQMALVRKEDFERTIYEEDAHRQAILTKDGILIGTIGFDQVNISAGSARLYVGIGNKAFWGKGYGYDAVSIFLGFLFQQWNFRRITAETWEKNLRALHCYQKLGFKLEGTLRESYYVRGQYYNGLCLAILKDEYTGTLL